MLQAMRVSWLIALLVALQGSCARGREPEKASTDLARITGRHAEADSSESRLARKERARIAMSGPILDIHAEGTSKGLAIRFRTRDLMPPNGETLVSVPLVREITVERVDKSGRGRVQECLVWGQQPTRMKEWRYGDSPAGCEKDGCGELAAGEYVMSVQILGGGGGIRLVVDEQGIVTPHPLKGATEPLWDGK